MNITLTDFRAQMFKLLPKVGAGEILTITHKKREYALVSTEQLRKLRLMEALSNLPVLSELSRDDVRKAIDDGRS
ncbi:MAG: hypothetical protein LBL30_03175 [Holosporales bacterium]|jgi:antitoxin (DNA-binding transcriptional repressor) of toxin-antitoxin stability system|nr:hypothetical protein [Holosporales bacterium]